MRLVPLLVVSRLLLLAAPAIAQEGGEKLVDRVVAVVDGTPVLYSDVMAKVNKGILVSVSEYPAEANAPAYEKALQDSINFELIMQRARDLEIDVRDDEVDGEIKAFLDSRGLNKDGLMEHLGQQGMTYEDYRDDFKDQMILRRFQGRVISPLVKLTDKDVETYYLKTAGASSDVVELVLRQILFSVSATAAPDVLEQKKNLAGEVHQKLKDGTPFLDAVKIYSDDAKARETGGLMAGLKSKDLAGPIRTAVETLEPGQFTEPVRTALGFHIFLLEEKKLSGSREFVDRKKQLEVELRTVELANQTKRWLTEQRQKSKVEVIGE
jgi:peptidyl-prolyl cis-trans isomerase SurA